MFRKLGLLLALGACTPSLPPASIPAAPISELARYYQGAEQSISAAGGLRTETNPADAPFTSADLQRNFIRIALFDEYTTVNGRYVARQQETGLRRWNRPVRVATIFGPSSDGPTRQRDTELVTQYTNRLADLTGLDMRTTRNAQLSNFLVLFLDQFETRQFASRLPEFLGQVSPAVQDAFLNSPRDILCAAFAMSSRANPNSYQQVIILVKAEHGPLMRESCIHEEMAQALGLTNDSPEARPSIFNDDEEFAFLTHHDEILLRMLYDPRLQTGMTSAQVRPLLPEITRDALFEGTTRATYDLTETGGHYGHF